jgi:DNA-3-methyladenine glycosylase II
MNQKVITHFQTADPILHAAAIKVLENGIDIPYFEMREKEKFFESLCHAIVNQQLSDKAAMTIYTRLVDLIPDKKVIPENIMKLSDEQMRGAGVSYQKIKYMKDLAQKVIDKTVDLESLPSMSDEDVIQTLTQIKGIGRWTAEMFLMFSLGREDIFSHGDLGLRNAIKKLYGNDNPTVEEVESIVAKWSPYRSWASRILWRSLDIK